MNTLAKWAIAVTLVGPCSGFGATVQYNINFTVGGQTVTGFIDTDGNTGVLAPSDITGGSITDSQGSFTVGGASVVGGGFGLEAVGSMLVFDPVGAGLLCGGPCGLQFDAPISPPFIELVNRAPVGGVPAADYLIQFAACCGPVSSTGPTDALTLGTVVPLPPAAWLLLSGLGGLGLLGSRRQQQLPV
jgi:hypothetical protein